jgi:cytochrome c oxidase subunit 3
MEKINHPYHLVDLSPWPLVTSLGALVVALGAALFVHDYGLWTLGVGIVLLGYALVGWFGDVIDEATVQQKHTKAVDLGLRYGMMLFVLTEALLFAGFFWGFFDASLFPSSAIDHVWPPKNIHPIDPFKLPYLNTLILLLSATSLTWSHASLLDHKQKEAEKGLLITIILGLLFTLVQVYEFWEAPFSFKDGIYASHFYMLTGFHGAHVLIGTGFLAVCFVRLQKGHFTPHHHLGFEAAAWYWHFVDVVWLFLFTFLYWGSV